MANNDPIRGDDQQWKRDLDKTVASLQNQITLLTNRVKYLEGRAK